MFLCLFCSCTILEDSQNKSNEPKLRLDLKPQNNKRGKVVKITRTPPHTQPSNEPWVIRNQANIVREKKDTGDRVSPK